MRGIVVSLWCGACAFEDPEKKITLTYLRYVIIDAKKTTDRLNLSKD